jgi:CO dehydrogenase/acetyl-CoA synthase beta subunit
MYRYFLHVISIEEEEEEEEAEEEEKEEEEKKEGKNSVISNRSTLYKHHYINTIKIMFCPL